MKKIFCLISLSKLRTLFLILVIVSCSIKGIYAQPSQYNASQILSNKALDSAYLRITYSLSYISDSLKPKQIWEDRKILLIGDSVWHFYSDYQRHTDSSKTVAREKQKSFKPPTYSEKIRKEGYDIFTYPTKGSRSVLEPITELSLYKYQEIIEKPLWQLSEDTCTFLSYKCHKAITQFRGRDWTVWFTMEIPIDAGPWKLCGLPGLIVKAYDSREHYVFECIALENISNKKQPIRTILGVSGNFIECSHQAYVEAQQQFYENYVNFLLAMGWNIFINDASGREIERIETPNTKFADSKVWWGIGVDARDRYRKIPYNPIELE